MAQLVRLTGLFGITENRGSRPWSRMAAGEATTNGSGTTGWPGHLAERQSRPASRSGATAAYSGWPWWSGSTAEVRTGRRRTLAYARLAELRGGGVSNT